MRSHQKPIVLLFLIWGGLASMLWALPVKTIAVIYDDESPYFSEIVGGFKKELESLALDQYELEIKTIIAGGASRDDTEKALNLAFEDPAVDAVFTAGLAVSHYALKRTKVGAQGLPKPVIAGGVEFSDLENRLISKQGTSTRKNYSFVLVPNRVKEDLLALQKLGKTKVVDVLVDKKALSILKEELSENVGAFQKKHGLTLRIHPVARSNYAKLSFLPSTSRAVYVPILAALNQEERGKIFKRLATKKIVNVSMLGSQDLDAGAFASLAPNIFPTLHRRLALNLHQVLLGVDPTLLPVIMRLADQVTINLKVAQQIGWSPDYDTSLTAMFVNEDEVVPSAGALDLESAMNLASKQNPDVRAARANWKGEVANEAAARSAFSTTASFSGNAGAAGVNRPISRFLTPENSQSASLGVEVNQLLYSDRLYSQIQAQGEVVKASEFDRQSVVLDTIETAAHAYLDALAAEAVYRIGKENLRLVQENLQLAKLRKDIGLKDQTDYLRWLASSASARSSLIRADSQRKNARVALNVSLAFPRQEHWDLQDISLESNESYFLKGDLLKLISDKNDFQGFIKFATALSTKRSVELQSFDHNLHAQGIALGERARRDRRPEIQLSADLQQVFQDSTITPSGSQTEWTVGVGFTMPFFEKDIRRADLSRIQAGMMQLEAQREKAKYLVEQRALVAAYNMAASHPAMRLTEQARVASEKNYNAVQNQYALGQVNVVTLLDAQSNYLTQEQAAATSVYTYMKDAVSLQRAMAWFEEGKSQAEIADFLDHYRDYLVTGSINVRSNNAK